jgi:hypothetical protein
LARTCSLGTKLFHWWQDILLQNSWHSQHLILSDTFFPDQRKLPEFFNWLIVLSAKTHLVKQVQVDRCWYIFLHYYKIYFLQEEAPVNLNVNNRGKGLVVFSASGVRLKIAQHGDHKLFPVCVHQYFADSLPEIRRTPREQHEKLNK